MKKSDINKVVNIGSVTQVLGSIMLEPTLLKENADAITINDFTNAFHKILFGAFSNLISDGVEALDIPTVVNYISEYPAQRTCFESNNGVEYLERLQEITNVKNFEFNLKTLKKFSKLREIAKSGVDITDLFDPNETEPTIIEQKNKELSKLEVSEICNYFMNKLITACGDNYVGSDVELYDTSQSIENTFNGLGASRLGLPLTNGVISTAIKGAVKGKFVVETTGTAGMKSRKMIREAVHLAIPYIYDLEKDCWTETKIPPQEVLYCNTEMDRDEVDIIILAYITGIDSEKIELKRLSEKELKIVEEAKEIVKQYPIHIAIMPEYDVKDVERLIQLHSIKYKIGYFFFDYIMSNPKLMATASRNSGGVAVREDQALLGVATSLKNLARKYKIFIWSAVQQNGTAIGDGAENRGVGVARGSKAIFDKTDMGMCIFRPSKNDIKKLEPILQGFGVSKNPNYGYSIFKNRSSKVTGCYLFTSMNGGNMREECIVVTDYNYNPIEFELLETEFSDDDNERSGMLDVTEEEFGNAIIGHGDSDERLF